MSEINEKTENETKNKSKQPRISPEFTAKLDAIAEKEERSFSWVVNKLVSEALEAREAKESE